MKLYKWVLPFLLMIGTIVLHVGCETSSESDNVNDNVNDSVSDVVDVVETECYSPFQNTENAYNDGSVGCACEKGVADVCVSSAALMCTDGYWAAVEDGPCMPRADACDSTLSDLQECMNSFSMCYVEAGGSICARNY